MSIMKSIRSGMSGLTANSRALGVVGDNIANANTAGFKAGRANFSDMLAGTTLGGGSGVQMNSVQQNFGQGDLEMTGNALDLGISGPGFFMVEGEVGGDEGTFYTRAGQFSLDADGYVATPGGMRLQGYAASADGVVDASSPGALNLGALKRPPRPTGSVAIEMNLSADAEIQGGAWDPADPGRDEQLLLRGHPLRRARRADRGDGLLQEDGPRRVGVPRHGGRRRSRGGGRRGPRPRSGAARSRSAPTARSRRTRRTRALLRRRTPPRRSR